MILIIESNSINSQVKEIEFQTECFQKLQQKQLKGKNYNYLYF